MWVVDSLSPKIRQTLTSMFTQTQERPDSIIPLSRKIASMLEESAPSLGYTQLNRIPSSGDPMSIEGQDGLTPFRSITSPTLGVPQPKGDIWWSNAVGFLAAHLFALLAWWYPPTSGWKTYSHLLLNWQVGMYGITIGSGSTS